MYEARPINRWSVSMRSALSCIEIAEMLAASLAPSQARRNAHAKVLS